MLEFFTPILHMAIFLLSLLVVVFTFGIVWRVEKRLDLSMKLILLSISAFTISEALIIFDPKNQPWVPFSGLVFRVLFILFFLFGTLEMRLMLRRLDGEIKDKK